MTEEFKIETKRIAKEKYGQAFLAMMEHNAHYDGILETCEPQEGETPEQWVDRMMNDYQDFLSLPEP